MVKKFPKDVSIRASAVSSPPTNEPMSVLTTALQLSEDYQAGEATTFTGKIAKVTIELKPAKPLDKVQTDQLEQNQALEQQTDD